MKLSATKQMQEIAFELFKDIQKDDLEYMYRGEFSGNLTESILGLAEANIEKSPSRSLIKKRVYFIMVEGLQNITRHQDTTGADYYEPGIFIIQKKGARYYITTGNLIKSASVEPLKERLERINSMEKKELTQYYKKVLLEGGISDKGGAGLGLIEMARKSGNKLLYRFKTLNNDYSYFYFQTSIPDGTGKEQQQAPDNSLNDILQWHGMFNDENILLNFKGAFNQDNLLSLLSILEGQMPQSPIFIKMYNIMVEMIQNIAKHTDPTVEKGDGNSGIFFLSEKENYMILTSGNYVKKADKGILSKKINFINSLEHEALDDYYNEVLLDFDTGNSKTTGLGFIDMRIKSGNQLIYNFFDIDHTYSFFIIQAIISMEQHVLKPLIIETTEDTPRIYFDQSKGIFEISEKSLPEDAVEFYNPIIEWIGKYSKSPNKVTNFNFKLDYFNTASSKQLIKILLLLEKIARKHDVNINWYYREIDEDMLALGRRYAKLINTQINLIQY